MNRVLSALASLDAPAPAPAPTTATRRIRVDGPSGVRSSHGAVALFAPLHYEPNYAYPLLVWLHGPGADEQQLKLIMPHVSLRNYVAAAPRAEWAVRGRAKPLRGPWRETPAQLAREEQRVFDLLAVAQSRYHIHERRVFLAGFDRGGTLALRLAFAHPDRFAGAASLGGPLPRGGAPLRRIEEARRLPLLLAAGRQSGAYRQQRMSDDLRLLHAAGMHVALRLYPCGQVVTETMLEDLNRWMMEQVAVGP